MDLNNDGNPDILSGSWPGEIYVFYGNASKSFKKPTTLKNRAGEVIKVGSASVVFVADWDADGLKDLLVGNIRGEIHFIKNEGSKKEPIYGSSQKLTAGGKAIRTRSGDSAPLVVDWDKDGVNDLLTGAGDGSVTFYRNSGSKKKPNLANGKTLIKVDRRAARDPETPSGMRSKIAVADWNNDGQLDILVGDYNRQTKKINLSAEDLAKYKAAQAALQKIYAKSRAHYTKRPKTTDKEAMKKWTEKSREISKEMRGPSALARRYSPTKSSTHGNVWIYLRKSNKASKPADKTLR